MNPTDQLISDARNHLDILNDAARKREGGRLIVRLLVRVRELEAERAGLRDALECEYKTLMNRMTCSERFERHGPSCGHDECYAVYRMRKSLASPIQPPTEDK